MTISKLEFAVGSLANLRSSAYNNSMRYLVINVIASREETKIKKFPSKELRLTLEVCGVTSVANVNTDHLNTF
jgi:hypothetical protein